MHTTVRMAARAGLVLAVAGVGSAGAQAATGPYPAMAPAERYMSPSKGLEIAQARSAAPPAISDSAEIMTLGAHGYERAVKGTNGFVCMVVRSWDSDFPSPEFWNPKMRAPHCFNAPAVRSVLPRYLERTKLVLGGMSKDEILRREKREDAAHSGVPAPGAMAYMMSKDAYLNDAASGPWHPHVMFFFPAGQAGAWGENAAGSPIFSATNTVDPMTIVMVPVAKWSNGDPR